MVGRRPLFELNAHKHNILKSFFQRSYYFSYSTPSHVLLLIAYWADWVLFDCLMKIPAAKSFLLLISYDGLRTAWLVAAKWNRNKTSQNSNTSNLEIHWVQKLLLLIMFLLMLFRKPGISMRFLRLNSLESFVYDFIEKDVPIVDSHHEK